MHMANPNQKLMIPKPLAPDDPQKGMLMKISSMPTAIRHPMPRSNPSKESFTASPKPALQGLLFLKGKSHDSTLLFLL